MTTQAAREAAEIASEAAAKERAIAMKYVADAKATAELTRSRSRQALRRRSVVPYA